MDYNEAKKLAETYINKKLKVENDVLVILDEETIEKKYGWYFFSVSRLFMQTENLKDMVVGNGPILVEKKSGNIIQFGTAHPAIYYIEKYENEMQKS